MKLVNSLNTSLVKLGLGLAIVASLVVPRAATAGGSTLKEGDAFPEITTFPIEGKLADALKGKVVVVDFWASWCGPCKESFPVMKDHPSSFTIVRDAKKKLVSTVNIQSMPTSFVLNGEGKIVSVHKGFHGAETRKAYVKEIEDLLKQTTAKN